MKGHQETEYYIFKRNVYHYNKKNEITLNDQVLYQSRTDIMQYYIFKTFLPKQIKAEPNNQAPRPVNTGDRNKLGIMKEKKRHMKKKKCQ